MAVPAMFGRRPDPSGRGIDLQVDVRAHRPNPARRKAGSRRGRRDIDLEVDATSSPREAHATWQPGYPAALVITVRRISHTDPLHAQEVVLREEVLLNPIGLTAKTFREMFPEGGDREQNFEHFVAVFDHPTGPRVVGTALLLPNYPRPGCGKLMQMAVDLQRQGEGIGTRLVVAMERRAFGELGLTELFCHARDTAYGFYESLGWAYDSDTFSEAGIPHRRMVFRPPPVELGPEL
jgi:GNAT superfamily N-acetyltransferase